MSMDQISIFWHRTDTPRSPYLTTDELKALTASGIIAQKQNLSDLPRLAKNGGYINQDEVELTPDTPNLDAILKSFSEEHQHALDEVRYITAGEGIFDIRSDDDRWVRVHAPAGTYLVVPALRYHRFFLTKTKHVKAIRLFKDVSGWKAIYR